MSALPFVKVYDSWYTTRSHVDLGPIAYNIGARLMSLANAASTRGDLRSKAGAPISADVIARETRWTKKQIQKAMAELVACGTLAVHPDGAWYFPEFRRWQESESAERVRQHRKRYNERYSNGDSNGYVTARSEDLKIKDHDPERAREEQAPGQPPHSEGLENPFSPEPEESTPPAAPNASVVATQQARAEHARLSATWSLRGPQALSGEQRRRCLELCAVLGEAMPGPKRARAGPSPPSPPPTDDHKGDTQCTP